MIVFAAEHRRDPVSCIVLSPDENTFASISIDATMFVCNSETGHCISGPFKFTHQSSFPEDACFSPDGKHILVRSHRGNKVSCRAVAWNIKKGEEVFRIEGFDFVFIHCGCNEGRIASMDWIDEDGSSFRAVTSTDSEDEDGSLIGMVPSEDQRPTRILVKLCDIGDGLFDSLFEVTGVTVTQFSPNGQYLAAERQSENAIELWNLEDSKITHQFPHPPGNLSSLYFSPTSDCLMAAFEESRHGCLWRLDTQQMASFDLNVIGIRLAVIHLPHTNRVFVPLDDTVEIWEVSTAGSDMIFETEPPTTSWISIICPSRDVHRLLIVGEDATVTMWNLEDLGSNQPVNQDHTYKPEIIAFSPSGKLVAIRSWLSTYIELRNTATWELVGPKDINEFTVAFSADDNRIAVSSGSLVTICDINHPENHLSFDTSPEGRRVSILYAAFKTCNDLVICSLLRHNDSDEISELLQVWRVKDCSECTFSVDINIDKHSYVWMAPDGLTLIITSPISCYSWNNGTAQFHPFHFADEAHLDKYSKAYSPDGKLFVSRSPNDNHVRVWDTRTGQLYGKPITMSSVDMIALSSALKDQSPGDLIALRYFDTYTIALFDVRTGHLYAQFCDPGESMDFIQDGTKLASYFDRDTIRVYDIADLAAKNQNAIHAYKPIPREMRDG